MLSSSLESSFCLESSLINISAYLFFLDNVYAFFRKYLRIRNLSYLKTESINITYKYMQ